MIYVLKSQGKGESNADYVSLLTFLCIREAEKHIETTSLKLSDGNKYWVRYDIVEPGEKIKPYAE